MKTVTDYLGNVYALDQVIAVVKGGTPHSDLPLPRGKPVAVLVYASGSRVDTLIPHDEVLAAWNPPAPVKAAAPGAPGIQPAPAGLVDAEAGAAAE